MYYLRHAGIWLSVMVVSVIMFTYPAQAAQKLTVKIDGATREKPVVALGQTFDAKHGRLVEGYAIVHYARSENASKRGPTQSVCYGFLAKGAKWKTLEPWIVNTVNTQNLDGSFILTNLGYDVSKYEAAAGKNILGDGTMTTNALVADTVATDNRNEILFADVDSPGAIAVTIVWGIFGGPTFQRELVEWDQVYDDVDFDWSMTGEADKMDFESIATHELGHSVGLADLYTTGCSEETMYGYATEGETKKQTLNSGDIAGIRQLYQ